MRMIARFKNVKYGKLKIDEVRVYSDKPLKLLGKTAKNPSELLDVLKQHKVNLVAKKIGDKIILSIKIPRKLYDLFEEVEEIVL